MALGSLLTAYGSGINYGGQTLADQVSNETDEQRRRRLLMQQQGGSGSALNALSSPSLGAYGR